MHLGGRLAAAIEVLSDISTRHRPAAEALRDWGLSHRFAGSGDRAAIGNIVYDALRRRRSAGWILDADTPRAHAFGALILESGYTPESLAARLEGDRFAPEPLSGEERAAIASRALEDAPDAVRADCPDWCVPHLEAAFGDDWVGESAALARRPELDMRANGLKASRDKVLGELARAPAKPAAMAHHGMRIAPIEGDGRHPNVQAEPAFRKGWFEIQDEGSQIVTELAGVEPGMQVLDFCAGAGGKTLAMSDFMDNRGQIFAHDADRQRLAPIFDRLKRAGCRNVQVLPDAGQLDALEGQMDVVLVDAPCTGSGTWRRRPDSKWRLTERQLETRIAEQQGVLDAAMRYVKPGGRLVYVTCSLFAAENRDQVEAFLGRHAGFSPEDHAAAWNARFPGHEDAARIEEGRGIVLSPARSQTDGFFVSLMRREQ